MEAPRWEHFSELKRKNKEGISSRVVESNRYIVEYSNSAYESDKTNINIITKYRLF